jgi:hypothetical protein
VWQRIYARHHPFALGIGPSLSRFSGPAATFGVVYLGSSLKVAFAETILRDRGVGLAGAVPIPLSELAGYACAEIRIETPLHLVDLSGDGCARQRVPTDVVGASDQTLARQWSQAFYNHPAEPDGVLYGSRINGERNLAIYDRAVAKLGTVAISPLLARRADMAQILTDFDLAIV